MKRKIIFLLVLLFISFTCLFIGGKSFAATDLDEITQFTVTVDPRMTDGTLDITYDITWKVLDSTSQGPLSWVQIGTPNQNFDTATALTENIKSISKYNGSYVRLDLDREYYAGEQINFKYTIHQSYMYELKDNTVLYNFTPAWFTDAEVKELIIRWNASDVTKSDNTSNDGNYLVWRKANMAKGEKLSTSVEYDKSSFTALDANKQSTNVSKSFGVSFAFTGFIFIFVIVIIFIIICSMFGGGGYYGHRGFYYGGFYGRRYRGGCAHSSCAHSSCAHSCACACAGSGRAGCSKKDFYGTNLTSEKIKKAIKK